MSSEGYLAVTECWRELWNTASPSIAYEVIHENYDDGEVRGQQGYLQDVVAFRDAFPDANFTHEEVIVAGDSVVVRWMVTGTHQGEFLGVAPTGRRATASGININRMADGKLISKVIGWDLFSFMRQLGAIPTPHGSS